MERITIKPRNNWQKLVERQGFTYHTLQDVPYWTENACYKFSRKQVDQIEIATTELHEMCIAVGQNIIDYNRFDLLGIPEFIIPLVKKAWNNSEKNFWSLYGRFDLAYDGINPPKMLEFNADTPTSLFEAAVVQWFWKEDYKPKADQFNSIDERLFQSWKFIHEKYNSSLYHFACLRDSGGRIPLDQLREDIANTAYILNVASRVEGINYNFMDIGDVHWDDKFVDHLDRPIETIFKLYPWEWMANEEYGKFLPESNTNWIEPIWKMLWSNKAILPILWELFPNNKYLLPAYFEQKSDSYVKKPKLSREGANITIVKDGKVLADNSGMYKDSGFIFQDIANIPNIDGNYPVIGSWIIGGEAAGMGVRESSSMITNNLSRFVPHYFE